MRNSYLVYGTRYCKFDEIYKWILDHQQAWLYETDFKTHTQGKYKKFDDGESEYFYLPETSIVFNEDMLASHNNECYRKSIIILRDLTDVIEGVLSRTFKPESVDRAIGNQIELFEEYTDEYIGETNKCPDHYTMFILYDRWLKDIDYRDNVARTLGFINTDYKEYIQVRDYTLRNRLRFKKHITEEIISLNKRIK
jgi:hypothetical protein